MFISIKQRINQRHYSLLICIILLLVQLGSIGPSKAAFLPARDSLMTSDSLFRAKPVEKYPMYHDEQPRLWNNHLINVKQTDSLFDYQKRIS
jgi:hypothetical protein